MKNLIEMLGYDEDKLAFLRSRFHEVLLEFLRNWSTTHGKLGLELTALALKTLEGILPCDEFDKAGGATCLEDL